MIVSTLRLAGVAGMWFAGESDVGVQPFGCQDPPRLGLQPDKPSRGRYIILLSMLISAGLGGTVVGAERGGESVRAGFEEQALFHSGEDGYHTYRIPALVVTNPGTILAFAEARKNSRRDHGDIDTVLKRSSDGGKTWEPLQLVWDDGPHTCGNPCPVVDRDTGTIWLHLSRNDYRDHQGTIDAGTSREPRTAWVTNSTDDGATWQKPVNISPSVRKPDWRWYGTGPCNGIQMRTGRLVIPTCYSAWVEKNGEGFANYYPNVIYSDDHGKTWQTGGTAGDNAGESTVVELSDGSLMTNVRNWPHLTRGRGVAKSSDGGLTWSDPEINQVLIDSGCQASLLSYTAKPEFAKNRLLFSNPASLQPRRHKMTVRLSYDDGKTWPASKVIHSGPSAYSNLVVLPDLSLGCLFERGKKHAYETIAFARFTLEWLTDGNDSLQRKSNGKGNGDG